MRSSRGCGGYAAHAKEQNRTQGGNRFSCRPEQIQASSKNVPPEGEGAVGTFFGSGLGLQRSGSAPGR